MRKIQFKKLSLKNFGIHEEIEMDFEQNKFMIICGRNGTGKTTIFEALIWALYDKTSKDLRPDEVVRERSGKNTEVCLTWEEGNNQYEIRSYRKHSKYKNNKYLYKNKTDISESTRTNTNHIIENILLPFNVFVNSLMFSQHIKSSFSRLTHSEQKEIIDKILGLETYDVIRKKIVDQQKKCNEKLEEIKKLIFNYESIIDMRRKDFSENSETYQTEITEYINKIEDSNKKINDLISNLQESDKINKEIETKSNEKRQIDDEVSELKTKIKILETHLNSQLDSLKNKLLFDFENKKNKLTNQKQNDLNKLQTENIDNEKIKSNITHNYEINKNKIQKNHTNKINEFKEKYEKYIQPISEQIIKYQTILTNNLSELDNKNNISRDLKDELQLWIRDSQKNNPTCFACGQDLQTQESINNVKTKINSIQKEIDKVGEEINTLTVSIRISKQKITDNNIIIEKAKERYNNLCSCENDEYNDYLEDLEKQFTESLTDIDNKIHYITNYIEKVQREIEKDEVELKQTFRTEYDSQCKQLKGSVYYDISQHTQKVTELTNNSDNINRCIEQLVQRQTKIIDDKAIIELERTKIQEYKNILEKRKKEKNEREKFLKKVINEHEEQLKKEDENRNSIDKQIEILKFWSTAFSDSGIKSIILDESIPILNEKAREITKLIPNIHVAFDSQTEIKSGTRNKFSINTLNTNTLSKGKQLSSGEERIVDIVILLCLKHLMEVMHGINFNILLFDEALEHLDPENSQTVLRILKSFSKDYFVALISHTLRDSVDCHEYINL